MVAPPIPNPRFPNVPIAPGVPPVRRDGTNPGGEQTMFAMTADAPTVTTLPGPKWGIFKSGGALALECDSVLVLEPSREFRISDYPVEKGGFASYDKVATPAVTRVSVTKGGTDSDRQGFLSTLDTLIETTDLFNVVTPDSAFLDRNFVRYDYRRSSSNGLSLITVEIEMMEVRETASAQFADSKQPSGAPKVNAGPVQSIATTAAELPPAAPPSTNPVIRDIPPLTDASTAAERASTVSDVIQAGGTINDLVAKNVSFLTVPTLARAAQSLTTTLGGQAVRLDILQKAPGLFVDVFVNGALVIGGVLAENDNAIVRSAYLGFAGDLFFHDTQNTGLDAPTFANLGGRYVLLYAGA